MNEKQLRIYWNTLCGSSGKQEALDEERKTLLTTISYPKTFYRFRPVTESSLEELENNYMYFSSADHYDDPFDTYTRTDIPKLLKMVDEIKNDPFVVLSIIKERFPGLDLKDINKESLKLHALFPSSEDIIKLRQNMQIDTYSVCFCESVRNESSWMKYADNHKGFVLEYNFSPEFIEELWNYKVLSANLLPVYYSDQKYNATDYAVRNLLLYMCRPTPDLYNELLRYLNWENTKISLIKNKCHKYDKEWRLVPSFSLISRDVIKRQPQSITIGLRTSKYTERTIIEAAKIAGINKFYKMEIDNRDRFVRKPING